MSATFSTAAPLLGGLKAEFAVVGLPALLGDIGARASDVIDALQIEMELAHIELANRVASGPLSGGVLAERTGNLRNSVVASPETTRTGDVITSVVGSDVVYARIHEYGGEIVPVHADYLTFEIDGQWIRTKHVTMPRRPWLTPTFEAMIPEILERLAHTIETVMGTYAE